MLLQLRIQNFAIIENLEMECSSGFTVITGETGAGKSILINALLLVLGGRANNDVIRTGSSTAEVEALFDISELPIIKARLEQRELTGDDPSTLIVRRVIGPKGKAKVIINGRLATVATLTEITAHLVDISGQHQQQSLLSIDNHLDILDTYGNLDELKNSYRQAYERYISLQKSWQRMHNDETQRLQQSDFLRFQLNEIDAIKPQANEEVELEREVQRLANADRIRQGINIAEALMYSEDGSAFDKLSKATAELSSLECLVPDFKEITEYLESMRRDLQDHAGLLQKHGHKIDAEPERLESAQDRLNELKKLCRKHGGNLKDVLERYESIRVELEAIENTDACKLQCEQALQDQVILLQEAANVLSQARRKVAKKLDRAIKQEVSEMELEGAVFQTEFQVETFDQFIESDTQTEFTRQGIDRVEFLWSANPGEVPKPLIKIISGGELSRLMLAVKNVLSAKDLVALYVFDEVDTGLGGKAADAIGAKIHRVASKHQSIVITHLAPIAAYATHHYRVYKQEKSQRTVSHICRLNEVERAEEIARMIDGARVTATTRKAAQEMLARI